MAFGDDLRIASAVSGVDIAIGRPHKAPLPLPADLIASVTAVNAVGAALAALLSAPAQRPSRGRVTASGVLEYFAGIKGKMYEGYPRQRLREDAARPDRPAPILRRSFGAWTGM
ncbi:hypothetical protein ATK36_0740 [Amycolatopsis sulphurea]|uniref:Uncharacterized protein n=1 Tax=Amycolatopsis sulphurea TaxID=76022 RepID=A0A2A9G2L2_9PSEU|nr:hypothetical protein [Amycolatopsis sulphurea]PFG57176.1 hypothetical protein ATK36_0740 [Amycolatopsis sulphurea]